MSKKLKELQLRQFELKQDGSKILKACEGRDMSDDEIKGFDAIEADLLALAPQLAAEEKMIERRRSMEALPGLGGALPTPVAGDPTGGWRSVAEFATAVRLASSPNSARIDPRLIMGAPTNVMDGGGASGEGFELPVQYKDQIWDMIFVMEDVMTLTDLEPTTARQVDYTSDETTPWGASGVVASWRAEGSQMSGSKFGTKGKSLSLHELYAFITATDELLEDAPRLNTRLTVKAAQALNWKIGEAVIYGTGTGQPYGWMSAPALVSVAKEAGQAAATLVSQNLYKMFSRLMVAPGDRPIWLLNREVMPQLPQMVIGDIPMWMPNGNMKDAPNGTLLGYPIVWSEHAKQLGLKGDVQLVSPKGYYALRRTQGFNFASSMHLYFDYGMQAFRWTFRFGGQPHLSAPVAPANGALTRSHFVSLDDRP
jgi:HK97 family phage major capsid protein